MVNANNKTSNKKKYPGIAPSPQQPYFPSKMLSPEAVKRIASIENSEENDTWEESDEVVRIEIRKPSKMVIPVRLPAEAWEKLRELAREVGVGPTTMARMWILERLKESKSKDLS